MEKSHHKRLTDPSDPLAAQPFPMKPAVSYAMTQERFTWNTPRARAAMLLARGDVSDDDIATLVGVNRLSLARWKTHPEFMARLAAHVEADKIAMISHGIASKARRVQALNDRWERFQQIIEDRQQAALDLVRSQPDMLKEVPGILTGMFVRTYKMVGTGASATLITEWQFDKPLSDALLAHEKQASQELGQWVEKSHQEGQVQVKFTLDMLHQALRDPTVVEGEYVEQ